VLDATLELDEHARARLAGTRYVLGMTATSNYPHRSRALLQASTDTMA
jgi:hypothetical protein